MHEHSAPHNCMVKSSIRDCSVLYLPNVNVCASQSLCPITQLEVPLFRLKTVRIEKHNGITSLSLTVCATSPLIHKQNEIIRGTFNAVLWIISNYFVSIYLY